MSTLMNNIKASGYKIPADAMNEIEKILDYKPFVRRVG